MIRKTVNRNDDILAYVDDDFIIHKKYGQVTGTLDVPYALLDIAINGLESKERTLLFRKKDFVEIINGQIDRLKKICEKYPEDEALTDEESMQ